jgi:hypothetical protein
MKSGFCKKENKTCRFCMTGKCYRPDKSYPDDFKNRSKIKLLGDLKKMSLDNQICFYTKSYTPLNAVEYEKWIK